MKRTTYTVKQVSDMSGVSVRTLHHYESVGLLNPKRRANGYREYTSVDVERLQQVLLFRECGMELAAIKRLIDSSDFDHLAALRKHLEVLKARRRQLDTLMHTVQKTIRTLEGEHTMTDEERFEGLKRRAVVNNERAYGAEARKRYGDETIDASNEKLLGMDKQQWSTKEKLEDAIIVQLQAAIAKGEPAGDAARKLAEMHEQWIRMHWPDGAYSREAHLGLAHGYLADKRFVDYYDERAGTGATEFLVHALETYLA